MHPVGAGLPANTVLKPLTHSRVNPLLRGGRYTALLLSDGPHRGVDLRLSSRKGLLMPVGAGLPANAVLKPLTHSRVNPLLQGKVCGLIALQWSARWHPPWRRSALEFAQGSADACRSGFTRECGVEATDAFAGEPAPTGEGVRSYCSAMVRTMASTVASICA